MSELPVGAVVAGLTIRGVAGRGGMGVVYRAFDPALHRSVALKVIAPDLAADREFRERFRRESRSAAAVDHPHIIGIHAAGEDAGLLYMAMRYVEGTDLKQLIRARGRLDPSLATTIVGQIAEALDAAHRRGLVHRDVKPANVLVDMTDGRPHAYLTDFGLTRPIGPGEEITRTGVLMGTFEYMAPELFNGAAAGVASDVYALGCVLHHTLTGEGPFRNAELVPMIAAHMSAPPPGLGAALPDPALRGALEQVISTALAKRPEDRQPSAGSLGSAARTAVEQARRAATVLRPRAAPIVDAPSPWSPPPEPPAATTAADPGTVAVERPVTVDRPAAQATSATVDGSTAPPHPVGPVYAAPPGLAALPPAEGGFREAFRSGSSWAPPQVVPASPWSAAPTAIGPEPVIPQGPEVYRSGPSWAPPQPSPPSPWSANPSGAGGPDPTPAPVTVRRRAPLALVAAVAVAVIGAGAVAWYTTGWGSSGSATGSTTTATPTSTAVTARIELAAPVDKTDSVTLTWTGPSDWDYGVDVAVAGQPATTTYVHRVSTWTLPVDPGKRYCFQVRGTDTQHTYDSNVEPLRGATCASG